MLKVGLIETPVALFRGFKVDNTGGVTSVALTEIEKSSIARPSSNPDALKSVQLIQKIALLAMFKPVIVVVINVLFSVRFPFLNPTALMYGELKSRLLLSTHVPLVRDVALRLYWKSKRSLPLPVVPQRHCSPVYEIVMLVIF